MIEQKRVADGSEMTLLLVGYSMG